MPTLSRIALTIPPADVDRSHVTDLAVQDVAGSNVLFATTRLDGVVASWNIGGGGLARIEADAYKSQALVGVMPGLGFVGDALLTGGGTGGQTAAPIPTAQFLAGAASRKCRFLPLAA